MNLLSYFQISLVIERILSFAVNSPLMKILTGLEFLLRQSQVIHDDISLSYLGFILGSVFSLEIMKYHFRNSLLKLKFPKCKV